jgi:uracil-DNA glycosylase family 4
MLKDWDQLNEKIIACKKCLRLHRYCTQIAEQKRRAYLDWNYWGKPVPNFGDPRARLLIVGLAPAAHGANRTGRMFTGDRSGDFLYRALWKAGFSNKPAATHRSDGLVLTDCAITAALHCAPPANKPTREEIHNCAHWFEETAALVPARIYLALGQFGWRAVIDLARRKDWYTGRIPRFAHGAAVELSDTRWLLGSYHPSQQNVFTGRLTEVMLDEVFQCVQKLLSRN